MRRRYDLVILGGGTGGLVAAQIAAAVGARVALLERERTGGDCLWTGCVPSKSLIASAAAAHRMRHAHELGLAAVEPEIDFARVMERVWRVIHTIEPHDSPEHLRAAGVEVIEADARFTGPGRIEACGRELRWRSAIIATGSEPVVPPIDGLADARPLTTDTVWDLRELPARLLVLGGAPIGCELAQALTRLGAQVTVVEMTDRLLIKKDPQAGELIRSRLESEGVRVLLGARAIGWLAWTGDMSSRSTEIGRRSGSIGCWSSPDGDRAPPASDWRRSGSSSTTGAPWRSTRGCARAPSGSTRSATSPPCSRSPTSRRTTRGSLLPTRCLVSARRSRTRCRG